MDAEIDQPEGDFLTAMGTLLLVGVLAMGIAAATGYTFFNEANDAVLTSKIVSERVRLTHPVCKATMTTSVAGVVDHRGCYTGK